MSAHSPLPWEVPDGGIRPAIFAEDGSHVASMSDTGDEAEANAALIVRAVNAHDELVAALRDLTNAYPESDDDNSEANLWARYGSEFASAVSKARAALAKLDAAS